MNKIESKKLYEMLCSEDEHDSNLAIGIVNYNMSDYTEQELKDFNHICTYTQWNQLDENIKKYWNIRDTLSEEVKKYQIKNFHKND